MMPSEEKQNQKRQKRDRRLTWVVSFFGGLVLLTLVVLITHLVTQALPLAMRPTLSQKSTFTVPQGEHILGVGDVMEGQPVVARQSDCRLQLLAREQDNASLSVFHDYIRPCEYAIKLTQDRGQNLIVDVSPNGQVRIVPVRSLAIDNAEQTDVKNVSALSNTSLSFALPRAQWHQQVEWTPYVGQRWLAVAMETETKTWVRWVNRRNPTRTLDVSVSQGKRVLPLPGTGGMFVQQGTTLQQYHLNTEVDRQTLASPVTWWQSLPKERTVLIQTRNNTLTRWVLHNDNGVMHYIPTWAISLPDGFMPSSASAHASSNGLALLGRKGKVLIMNRVTGEVVSTYKQDSLGNGTISWFGKRMYVNNETQISVLSVSWLSGITTWSSLFEPQVYEGYDSADTLWQTTSASDYQEEKYSLVPLLVGSLKASLLALIIAIPVAVGAAIYSAFFSDARLRQWLKPAIELLEAIPSVLIGFIAAIWLAPMAEEVLFSFAFFLLIVPLLLLLFALVQSRIAGSLPKPLRKGAEVVVFPLLILGLGFISIHYAPQWLFTLLGIDGFTTLFSGTDSPVGKTTMVVAIALGVAISPSIYSLADDAINGVPEHLKHASFALGATRLQTLHRVVLRLALPGIMAAIMLGFGRAFGETMIVLMVTGNTPVTSWSLFEGLRALTANLAIELPEADVGSIHYQILFLTACILFAFTFVVNTCAELLRQRLRKYTDND